MISRFRRWASWEFHRTVELTGGLYLIVLDKIGKLFLLLISAGVLIAVAKDPRLHLALVRWDGQLNLLTEHHLIDSIIDYVLDKLLNLSVGAVKLLAVGLMIYAVFEVVELVGLLRGKRWAEYLIFLATAVLLPPECVALAVHFTWVRLGAFVINFAIVAYLVGRQRLFFDREAA